MGFLKKVMPGSYISYMVGCMTGFRALNIMNFISFYHKLFLIIISLHVKQYQFIFSWLCGQFLNLFNLVVYKQIASVDIVMWQLNGVAIYMPNNFDNLNWVFVCNYS